MKGSPTWTVGRLSASSSPSSWLASTEAPPIPSRRSSPVEDDEPAGPAQGAAPGLPAGGRRHRVHEHVVAVGVVEDRLAADRQHTDRVPVGADPGDGAVEARSPSARAEPVQESDRPRAHSVASRRIPPTPVQRPGTARPPEGWLWLSTLKQTASPSPRSSTPAFSPGLLQHAFPRGGEAVSAEGPNACSRSAPTRGARRPPARSGSGHARAVDDGAPARRP